MAGFTLYPDKAYLEVKGKLFNRTPFPQTFLWWANPAVKVNDHYQSIFPPDVHGFNSRSCCRRLGEIPCRHAGLHLTNLWISLDRKINLNDPMGGRWRGLISQGLVRLEVPFAQRNENQPRATVSQLEVTVLSTVNIPKSFWRLGTTFESYF